MYLCVCVCVCAQVHEPRYVQMFEVIMEVARAEMNIARFGMFHNLRSLDESHPTASSDTTTSDNIAIGSCCHVCSHSGIQLLIVVG